MDFHTLPLLQQNGIIDYLEDRLEALDFSPFCDPGLIRMHKLRAVARPLAQKFVLDDFTDAELLEALATVKAQQPDKFLTIESQLRYMRREIANAVFQCNDH